MPKTSGVKRKANPPAVAGGDQVNTIEATVTPVGVCVTAPPPRNRKVGVRGSKRRNWPKKVVVLLDRLDSLIRRHLETPLTAEQFQEAVPNSVKAFVTLDQLDLFPQHNLQYGQNVIAVSDAGWSCTLCDKTYEGNRISKVYKHLCSKKHKQRLLARIAQFGSNNAQFGHAATELLNPFIQRNFVEYLGRQNISAPEAERQFHSDSAREAKKRMIADQLDSGTDQFYDGLERRFWEEWCALHQSSHVIPVSEVLNGLTVQLVQDFLARQMFKYRTIDVIADPAIIHNVAVTLRSYIAHASTLDATLVDVQAPAPTVVRTSATTAYAVHNITGGAATNAP
jgi:hypothetical protein